MKKLCFILSLLLIFLSFPIGSYAYDDDISPGITVLKNNIELNKCGIFGEEINFCLNDYSDTVGTDVKYITITAIPNTKCGRLYLNGGEIISGQTISAYSLDYMKFLPADNSTVQADFTFRVNSSGWESTDIHCNITYSQSANTSPVIKSGKTIVYRNAMGIIKLNPYDPDGDGIFYSVVSYPENGKISIADNSVIYTPEENFTGNDSMCLCAYDKFGNMSSDITLDLEVKTSDFLFCDMESSPLHSAALRLAEENIITYGKTDGLYYFMPDEKVKRIDFTVMLLSKMGIDISGDTEVSFTDTASLSYAKKKYLACAVSLGLKAEDTFRPNDYITVSEAEEIAKAIGFEYNTAALSEKGEDLLTKSDLLSIFG